MNTVPGARGLHRSGLRVGLAGLARGPRCAAPGLEREGSGALESGRPGPGVATFKTVTQLCALLSHQSEPESAVNSAGADAGRRQENEVLNQATLGGCSVLISPAASQAAGNLQNKGRFPPGLLTARFPPLPRETGRNRLCVAPCSE